jgi:NTP pyrophosphatase (non-canonical NTP hydrolase)
MTELRKAWREGRQGELSRTEKLLGDLLANTLIAATLTAIVLFAGGPLWAALGFGLLTLVRA